MAQVQIADVVVPDIFTAHQVENSFIRTAFYESGVAVRNGVTQEQLGLGSEQFTVPTCSDLGDTEPNYSTNNPADVALPEKIVVYRQTVRKTFANNVYSTMDLAAEQLSDTARSELLPAPRP